MTPDAAADAELTSGERQQRGRWRLTAGALALGGLVLLIDQGTKAWAEATLTVSERLR